MKSFMINVLKQNLTAYHTCWMHRSSMPLTSVFKFSAEEHGSKKISDLVIPYQYKKSD